MVPFAAVAQANGPADGGNQNTLQITSRIVYVDVVVRDSAGNVVRGLTEKDFKVLEDGKAQKISFFADHTHDAAMPVESPAGKLDFSNVGPVSNSVNIILFDFNNTATLDQLYARKQMIRFLESLPPGHQTALFVLGKRLHMLQNFTESTDQLVAAAKAMKMEPSMTETTGEMQQEGDFVSEFEAAVGRSPTAPTAATDGLLLEQGAKAQQATDITQLALNEIAAAVSGYPGRKNLYWLADQFPLYGGPALEIHELSSAVTGESFKYLRNIPEPRSLQDIAEANEGIANAQIAVYPILLTGVEASGMGPEARGMTSTQEMFTRRAALQTMMNNLAYTTGGQAFYGTNDFASALRKGFEDGSNYYTLAYDPTNAKWNGAFRKIKVQLAEHGYSLSYRRGYYATNASTIQPNPAKELSAALQPSTPESTMLRLRSSVALPDKRNPYVVVKTAVDLAGIDFSTDASGVRHGKLLVLLVALNQDGAQPDSPPQASGVLRLDFTPEQYRTVLKTGIEFALRMPLKPGNYRLRLGVTDMDNHRLGTLDMPVVVP